MPKIDSITSKERIAAIGHVAEVLLHNQNIENGEQYVALNILDFKALIGLQRLHQTTFDECRGIMLDKQIGFANCGAVFVMFKIETADNSVWFELDRAQAIMKKFVSRMRIDPEEAAEQLLSDYLYDPEAPDYDARFEEPDLQPRKRGRPKKSAPSNFRRVRGAD